MTDGLRWKLKDRASPVKFSRKENQLSVKLESSNINIIAMKCLEIIELRASGNRRDLLASQLQSIISLLEKKSSRQKIKIYTRVLVESDYSIMLYHDTVKTGTEGSRLGLHLASALKAFGLVSHSIWNELNSR